MKKILILAALLVSTFASAQVQVSGGSNQKFTRISESCNVFTLQNLFTLSVPQSCESLKARFTTEKIEAICEFVDKEHQASDVYILAQCFRLSFEKMVRG